MILEYNSKDPKAKVNNVKLLSVYETELIFITKIYTKESYFYAEDKNFNLKLSKMLYL